MTTLRGHGGEQLGHVGFVGDIAVMHLYAAKRRAEKVFQLTHFLFRDPGHVYGCSRFDESPHYGAPQGTRAARHQDNALHDERLAGSGQEIK